MPGVTLAQGSRPVIDLVRRVRQGGSFTLARGRVTETDIMLFIGPVDPSERGIFGHRSPPAKDKSWFGEHAGFSSAALL